MLSEILQEFLLTFLRECDKIKLYEKGIDRAKNETEAVMTYVTKNPRNLTAEQINSAYGEFFGGLLKDVRELGADFTNINSDKLILVSQFNSE
ncbi:hypothetical protein FACS1894202_02830 [Clostridia bacterium]|nr:hypothetical protein FACS1894202_02830 [Clostridia bacterium]